MGAANVVGMAVLAPATYDVVWSLFALAGLALTVVALVRWWRADVRYSFVWFVVILLVPWLGAAAFLLTVPGRREIGRAHV